MSQTELPKLDVEDARDREHWLARLIRKRYGIGMLVALVLLVPVGSTSILEPITGNAFLLDTYLQLFFLTVANTMATVHAIAINRLLNNRFHGTWITRWLGNGKQPWEKRHFLAAVFLGTTTPLLLAFFYGSDFSGWYRTEVGVASLVKHLFGSAVSIGTN